MVIETDVINRITIPEVFKFIDNELAKLPPERRKAKEEEFNASIQRMTEHNKYIEEISPFFDKELNKIHKTYPRTVEYITIEELLNCAQYKDIETARQKIVGSYIKTYIFYQKVMAIDYNKPKKTDEELEASALEEPLVKYFDIIFEAAHRAWKEYSLFRNTIALPKKIKISSVSYPLDKISATLFPTYKINLNRSIGLSTAISTGKEKKTHKEGIVTIDLFFDELKKISNINELDITHYDFSVMTSVANLYYSGSEYITFEDIYRLMSGKEQRPAKKQTDKIKNSIEKLSVMQITIDNSAEIGAGFNYPMISVKTTVLEGRLIKIQYKGKVFEGFKINEEPILFQFAKGRGQITTIKNEIFQLPCNTTENNLAIQDYLLRVIAMAKNNLVNALKAEHNVTKRRSSTDSERKKAARLTEKSRNLTIMLSTVFSKLNVETADKYIKKRYTPVCENILSNFVNQKYIHSFTIDNEKIFVEIDEKPENKKNLEKRILKLEKQMKEINGEY